MGKKKALKISFCCDDMKENVRSGAFNQGIEDGSIYVEVVGKYETFAIDFCPFCGRPVETLPALIQMNTTFWRKLVEK